MIPEPRDVNHLLPDTLRSHFPVALLAGKNTPIEAFTTIFNAESVLNSRTTFEKPAGMIAVSVF
jgi:hypothetical protein